jgi:hypothetical protein
MGFVTHMGFYKNFYVIKKLYCSPRHFTIEAKIYKSNIPIIVDFGMHQEK